MSREEAVVQEPNREFLLYEAPDLIRSQTFPQARRGFDPKEVAARPEKGRQLVESVRASRVPLPGESAPAGREIPFRQQERSTPRAHSGMVSPRVAPRTQPRPSPNRQGVQTPSPRVMMTSSGR